MITCAELIWLTKYASTYCMREKGHTGEHYIYNREPTKEELEALKKEYSHGQISAKEGV